MTCFRCGGDGFLMHTYMHGIGFFAIGGEPRTCRECSDTLIRMPDEEKRREFSAFESTAEPPSGARDVLGDMAARSLEIRRRGQA